MSEIERLCKKHTSLTPSDVKTLETFEKLLPIVAEAQGCDVFIDCSTPDPNRAIVVAEYRPKNSLYRNSVVGMFAYRNNEPAAVRTLETGMPSRGLKALTQESIDIIQNVSAINNKEGETIGVFIMEQSDVPAFKRVQKEDGIDMAMKLIAGKSPGLNITTYINDAIIYFNFEATSIYSNPQAQYLYKNLGYRDNITGMPFQNLVFGNVKFSQIVEKKWIVIDDFVIGNYVLKIQYNLMEDQESEMGVAMLITDMTDVKNKENELILKSVAIREIHHRVKNNLQTVASLLRLQSRRVKDKDAKRMLQENINRILSIALTHEVLAHNGMDEIPIKDILRTLVQHLVQASAPYDKKITVEVTGDDFLLNSETATTISLIINELIQNSFDHGFNEMTSGKILVEISKKDLQVVINVIDNGSGYVKDTRKAKNLGLQIVSSMVRDKLGGNFAIKGNNHGTKATIMFAIV